MQDMGGMRPPSRIVRNTEPRTDRPKRTARTGSACVPEPSGDIRRPSDPSFSDKRRAFRKELRPRARRQHKKRGRKNRPRRIA